MKSDTMHCNVLAWTQVYFLRTNWQIKISKCKICTFRVTSVQVSGVYKLMQDTIVDQCGKNVAIITDQRVFQKQNVMLYIFQSIVNNSQHLGLALYLVALESSMEAKSGCQQWWWEGKLNNDDAGNDCWVDDDAESPGWGELQYPVYQKAGRGVRAECQWCEPELANKLSQHCTFYTGLVKWGSHNQL